MITLYLFRHCPPHGHSWSNKIITRPKVKQIASALRRNLHDSCDMEQKWNRNGTDAQIELETELLHCVKCKKTQIKEPWKSKNSLPFFLHLQMQS